MHEHEHPHGVERRIRHGHHGHGRGRRGHGRGFGFGRDFPNRQEMIAELERHQRDLEQRTADVADMIRRLKADEPAASAAAAEPIATV